MFLVHIFVPHYWTYDAFNQGDRVMLHGLLSFNLEEVRVYFFVS